MEALLVALDVAGAFDKVWWKALLHKLIQCGCKGKALKLLKSYFKNRFLYVVAMGIASTLQEFYSGVPQGGIWSPKFGISTSKTYQNVSLFPNYSSTRMIAPF